MESSVTKKTLMIKNPLLSLMMLAGSAVHPFGVQIPEREPKEKLPLKERRKIETARRKRKNKRARK